MMKSEDEAYDLFEMFSKNSINHVSLSSYERTMGPSKRAGLYEVKNLGETDFKMDLNSITQKLEKVDLLAQKVDQILSLSQQTPTNQPSSSPSPRGVCALCAGLDHHVIECPTAVQLSPFIQEQVQATQEFSKPNNDPFSNTYNLGWRNHPNFS